jgi:hypothetical protein
MGLGPQVREEILPPNVRHLSVVISDTFDLFDARISRLEKLLADAKKIGDFLLWKKIHGQPAESGTENLEFVDLFASNLH